MSESDPPHTSGGGHRRALVVLLLALAAVLLPPLLRGRVLYGHTNDAHVGASLRAIEKVEWPHQNQSQLYQPETHAHLVCEHEGRPGTWNPHNELGRPLVHLALGTSFLPSRGLSLLTDDPYRFTTLQSLLALTLSALFAFGFLRRIGCGPWACLTGALGISIGPLFTGWPMYTMIQWGYCWAFGSLLAVERWLERPSPTRWIAIAFCVHAVLVTGFPQHVLLLGWVVGGWTVLRTLESAPRRLGRARLLAWIALAAVAGILASLPVYADLFVEWSRSTRAEYSARAWPGLPPGEFTRYVLSLYGIFWRFDAGGSSCSLSPLYASLTCIACLGWRRQRAWYWGAWALYLVAARAHPTVGASLRAFGLALSNWSPIYGAILPFAVLSALGVERVLGATPRERRVNFGACALLMLAAVLTLVGLPRLPGWELALGLGAGLGACLFAWTGRGWILAPLLAASVLHQGQTFVRWQERAALHEDSELATELRERTRDGSRYAWIGRRFGDVPFLPPNQDIPLGLNSVHTYYHLQSRAYDSLFGPASEESPGRRSYSRRFDAIHSLARITPLQLRRTGVSTLVSRASPPPERVERAVRIGPVWVSSLRERGPLAAVVPLHAYRRDAQGAVRLVGDDAAWHPAAREVPAHDRASVRFDAPEAPALLFLSQQYHPHWRARSAGRELATVPIDGFFQGVLLPKGTTEVELAFEPWVRWAWLPQWLFGLAAAVAVLRGADRQRRSSSSTIAASSSSGS